MLFICVVRGGSPVKGGTCLEHHSAAPKFRSRPCVLMPPKKPLPRVPYLKTKKSWNAQHKGEASCLPALTNLLNCWASYEEGAPQCAKLAQDLKDCMSKKRVKPPTEATPDFVKLLKRVNPPPHD